MSFCMMAPPSRSLLGSFSQMMEGTLSSKGHTRKDKSWSRNELNYMKTWEDGVISSSEHSALKRSYH
jgi:hypothetical protein